VNHLLVSEAKVQLHGKEEKRTSRPSVENLAVIHDFDSDYSFILHIFAKIASRMKEFW